MSRQIRHENVWDFYTKEKALGSGSYATVFKSKSKKDTKDYAIKIIQKKDMEEKDRKRLATESSIMLSVDHPHVIHCYDIFEDDKELSFVLEFVETGDLFDHISSVGHFSEVTVASLIGQVLSGLEYLHEKGISHRDLKVENLLCCSKHGDMWIQIADFGLSKEKTDGLETQVGSLEYAAPEIFLSKPYSSKCDIWSVGVITFILLTGHFPFHSKNPHDTYVKISQGKYSWGEWDKEISKEAKDFVGLLLNKDPTVRPTAKDALASPWLAKRDQLPEPSHKHKHTTHDLLKNFKKSHEAH